VTDLTAFIQQHTGSGSGFFSHFSIKIVTPLPKLQHKSRTHLSNGKRQV